MAELEGGYLDFESSTSFQPIRIDLDAMVVKVQERDALRKSETPDGRAFRWWELKTRYITRVCSDRLTEPTEE